MRIEDFKTIVKNEQLMEPILNQKPINLINTYGYYYIVVGVEYEYSRDV